MSETTYNTWGCKVRKFSNLKQGDMTVHDYEQKFIRNFVLYLKISCK